MPTQYLAHRRGRAMGDRRDHYRASVRLLAHRQDLPLGFAR
jgi:hypothetical protein